MMSNTGTRSMLKMMILPLAAGFVLTFQNCGPAQVELNGGIQTGAQLSIAPDTTAQVNSLFDAVLGRLPTSAEMAQYSALIAQGLSSTQLQSLLAGSSSASSSLAALLQQYTGSSNAASVASYQQLLKNGVTIAQIESIIKGAR